MKRKWFLLGIVIAAAEEEKTGKQRRSSRAHFVAVRHYWILSRGERMGVDWRGRATEEKAENRKCKRLCSWRMLFAYSLFPFRTLFALFLFLARSPAIIAFRSASSFLRANKHSNDINFMIRSLFFPRLSSRREWLETILRPELKSQAAALAVHARPTSRPRSSIITCLFRLILLFLPIAWNDFVFCARENACSIQLITYCQLNLIRENVMQKKIISHKFCIIDYSWTINGAQLRQLLASPDSQRALQLRSIHNFAASISGIKLWNFVACILFTFKYPKVGM